MKTHQRRAARPRLAITATALLCACWAALAADDPQPLQEWPVTAARLPQGVSFYQDAHADLEAQASADPAVTFPGGLGAMIIRVVKSPCTQAAHLQLYTVAHQDFGRGGKYRVSFFVRASQQVPVTAAVILDDAPYSALGPGASAELQAGPDWQQCQLAFSPDGDVAADAGVRTPYFGVGRVPPGTTVWVAGIALTELQAPPPPVPLLRSDELLKHADFAAGTAGWSPQTAEITAADGACLVTKRTARWGTPVQDLRADLAAHGVGFYEFGAAVRAVKGKGETFAVIHWRDETGDHWVTSDTRPLRDTGYTRLSAERFIRWTGDLQAADLGVQTGADDLQDLLVDDCSVRAMTNLARGRPVASSGDAPGHAAALACDGDLTTNWQASSTDGAWLEIDLGRTLTFNTCVVAEEGARVRSYAIETWVGDQWVTTFTGGVVLGGLDELHFAPASGRKVRLRLTRSDGPPAIRELALYTTAVRERTARVASPPADPSRRGDRTLVGAIRWDGWCGDKSAVGLGLEQAMSPERYRYRVPFYAQVHGPGQVQIRCVTQEAMDREIAFARAAGIDYWAFDWYRPDDGLSTARSLYLSSAHRNDVRWCLISGTAGFLDMDRRWLIEQFQTLNYQKVLGDRPLLYIFDANRRCAPLVKALREDTAAIGCPTPFVVLMGWSPDLAEVAAATGADAIGAYVNPYGNGSSYAAGMANERSRWEAWRRTGTQMVPTVTTGWDPRPFLDYPVPWYPGATETNWGEAATPDQIAEQLRACLDFVEQHPDATLANAALIYAWNENAEGGWIIPTLSELENGGIPRRLDAVRSVLRPGVPRGSGWGSLPRE